MAKPPHMRKLCLTESNVRQSNDINQNGRKATVPHPRIRDPFTDSVLVEAVAVPGIPLNIMSIVYQNVGLVYAPPILWTALYKLATFAGSVRIIV